MSAKGKKIDCDKLLQGYLTCLKDMNEYIPSWIEQVSFSYGQIFEDATSTVIPEHNVILYGSNATEHSIVHELEHLRSRHNEISVGWDEDFEKNVPFYFVGFREYGVTGLFLEEGLNEISARKIYLKMISNKKELKENAKNEYKINGYYNFEMLSCLALCALIGEDIGTLLDLKFSGDSSGQGFIAQKMALETGNDRYWGFMQMYLDDYEFSKRLPIDKVTRNKVAKHNMHCYFDYAYKYLYHAVSKGSISKEELVERMKLFEFYTDKAIVGNLLIQKVWEETKQCVFERNKKMISQHNVFYDILEKLQRKTKNKKNESVNNLKLNKAEDFLKDLCLPSVFEQKEQDFLFDKENCGLV